MNPLTATLYQRSPAKAVRPTIAPDVIVLQVSANANWNSQNASIGTPVDPYVSGVDCRKKYWCPMKPFPAPNMNAKPKAQKRAPQRQVSTMPSSRMFTVSRVRENPASRNKKPACMKKTRNAALSVQTVLRGLTHSECATAVSAACAGRPKYSEIPHSTVSSSASPSAFPPRIAKKTRGLRTRCCVHTMSPALEGLWGLRPLSS